MQAISIYELLQDSYQTPEVSTLLSFSGKVAGAARIRPSKHGPLGRPCVFEG